MGRRVRVRVVSSCQMTRDMDLIRAILLKLADHEHGYAPELDMADYSDEQIGFHVHLLGQAGLLITIDITNDGAKSPRAIPLSVTWQGYEFLETARSESLWRKALSRVGKAGVGVSFEILKLVLVSLAKNQIGIST
jgi:hypothetical protein